MSTFGAVDGRVVVMNRIPYLIVATSVMLGTALRAPADLPVKAVYGPETLTMLPGGDHLIACVGGEFLRLVDIKTGKTLRTWQSGHTTPITNVVPSPSDNRIYTVSQNEIRAWNPYHGKLMARAEKAYGGFSEGLVLSADGTRALTVSPTASGQSASLVLRDSVTLTALASLPAGSIDFGVLPAIVTNESTVYSSRGEFREQLVAWNYETGEVRDVAFDPTELGIVALHDSAMGLLVISTVEYITNSRYNGAIAFYDFERYSALQSLDSGGVLQFVDRWKSVICPGCQAQDGVFVTVADLEVMQGTTLTYTPHKRLLTNLQTDEAWTLPLGNILVNGHALSEEKGLALITDDLWNDALYDLRRGEILQEYPRRLGLGPLVDSPLDGRIYTLEKRPSSRVCISEFVVGEETSTVPFDSSALRWNSTSLTFNLTPDGRWFLLVGDPEQLLWSFEGDLIPRAYLIRSGGWSPFLGGDSEHMYIGDPGIVGTDKIGLFTLDDVAFNRFGVPLAAFAAGPDYREAIPSSHGKVLITLNSTDSDTVSAYSVPGGNLLWSFQSQRQEHCCSEQVPRLEADNAGKFVAVRARLDPFSPSYLSVHSQHDQSLLYEMRIDENLRNVSISDDGALMALVDSLGQIHLLDTRTGEPLDRAFRVSEQGICVNFSSEGTAIYTIPTFSNGSFRDTPAIHSIDNPRMLGAVARERFLDGDFIRRPPVTNPYHPPADPRDLNGDGIQDAGDLVAGFVVVSTESGKGAP